MTDAPANGHPSPISAASDLLEYFREELESARDVTGLEVTETTEAYLVHLLDGYTRVTAESRDELGFSRPAAFMYGDAVQGTPGRRLEAYRRLGDACLYNCGFFDARLNRRAISVTYYRAMGRNAYDHADGLMRYQGGTSRNPFAAIFGELAGKFDGIVATFKRLSNAMRKGDDHADLDALVERMRRGEKVLYMTDFRTKK